MTIPQRPTNDDPAAWRAYWQNLGQSWRREQEIDEERQKELANYRCAEGFHPFRNVKLSRQDVEWLLATHESGQGPVDWSDEKQRSRRGLNLNSADLGGVGLAGLAPASSVLR